MKRDRRGKWVNGGKIPGKIPSFQSATVVILHRLRSQFMSLNGLRSPLGIEAP